MVAEPDVSVVMSVYNGACHLSGSIESILRQESVDFEFIIVNDGSTDDSPRILEEYTARERRIRLIHQKNQGLTKALIRGCAAARGNFIARQDVGDLSLPGRLAKELDLIRTESSAVLVSCGTRFVGPKEEYLFDVLQSSKQATSRLETIDPTMLQGPSCHPCTLFRKNSYLTAGGYRAQFRIAQDLDLWVRLIEKGRHQVVPEILYQAEYSLKGISAGRSSAQRELLKIIAEGTRLRRSGRDETHLLEKAQKISKSARRKKGKPGEAAYFIGTCLRVREPLLAKGYFVQAIKENPVHIKAWIRLFQVFGATSKLL